MSHYTSQAMLMKRRKISHSTEETSSSQVCGMQIGGSPAQQYHPIPSTMNESQTQEPFNSTAKSFSCRFQQVASPNNPLEEGYAEMSSPGGTDSFIDGMDELADEDLIALAENIHQEDNLPEDDDFGIDASIFDEIEEKQKETQAMSKISHNGQLDFKPTTNVDQGIETEEQPYQMNRSSESLHLSPFLRQRFPDATNTSSFLPNIGAGPRILTCFRIAEIFRVSSLENAPLLEVFANVMSSESIEGKQVITMSDIFFPTRPPYIKGFLVDYKTNLFENEEHKVLQGLSTTSLICRAICTPILRPDHTCKSGLSETNVEILSIWRSSWEDVEYSKEMVA